jgi:hypothetical protein
LLQDQAIDVATWPADDKYGAAYPEGARPKRTVFSPADTHCEILKPDWRYLFKQSATPYPEQFWVEVVAYQVGLQLGISVPPAFAAFDSTTGRCGALIEWFYRENEQTFIPAGDIFQQAIPDFDRRRGTQHNLLEARQFSAQRLGRSSFIPLAMMLMFDSLIGNSDRHQDNWGYLVTIERNADGTQTSEMSFAPWFDNGTSLGHERFVQKVEGWNDARFRSYIERGCHHFRESRTDTHRITHVESMRMIAEHAPSISAMLRAKLERFDIDVLHEQLLSLSRLDLPNESRLTAGRVEFMMKLIGHRKALLQEILQ